ncbi:major facilitator superfamily domain-containing protein [Lipomyces tetrasporus]|uniref:Major facilitator superfamily domain-containing protein n=1 Tax=Lipomyces tetrasporus TaxID=54092 RepID=A0AAD7QVY7_9ASCO|nr:major facilitator superfamily domain-containing protein [Lipomyces tetrasporus]KAJ8102477.1 major facilitator superfamily domain-containing protein [Lipomyces tetrasporus]
MKIPSFNRRHSLSSITAPLLSPTGAIDEDDDGTVPIVRAQTTADGYYDSKLRRGFNDLTRFRSAASAATYNTLNSFFFEHIDEDAYLPDVGLRPWLAALGGFCAQFCSFGYMNVIGLFQTYYETHQLVDLSPSTISWIGSIQTFILAFGGLFCGRICDMYGPRWLTVPGCLLLTLGVCMTALCTEYYQFVLAQGVCSAIGASALFYATTSAITGWFSKRRGLAFGVAASGASFGGITLPFLFDAVSSRASFGMAVYCVAILLFIFSFTAVIVTTSRLAPSGRQPYRFVHFYLRPYFDPVFALVTLSLTIVYLGLFVPFAFVASHALANGLSLASAFHLIAYLNAGSLAGRLFSGMLSDKAGNFNIYILVCFMSGIVAFPFWYLSTTEVGIIVVAAAYGFASGGVLAMYPALIAHISPVREIGTRVGAVSAAIAFGALASLPIAGAIVGGEEDPVGNYNGMQIYAGVAMMAGSVIAVIAKGKATGGKLLARE